MGRLRYILHPIGCAKYLYRQVNAVVYRRLSEPQFRDIRRGQRDLCWCGGELLPFKWHPSYGVCADCGCYVDRRPPLQEELKRVYSLDLYWHKRQKWRGYPPLETRAELYRLDGRLDYWLRLIEKYGPVHGKVIEVGCAPGVLLAELQKRGYECIGIEVDAKVAEWIHHVMNVDVRDGLFPGVEAPACNLFLAFDVLEHSSCPKEFMCEVSRLLNPDGIAIIQTAIDRYDYNPPFGKRFDMFDDIEHPFLFTDKAMQELARRAGLEVLNLEEGLSLAGEICIFRKPK
ncbi:MAG: class I SAM-dependent methyltransferase [Deltaproteobacteria bacterium]